MTNRGRIAILLPAAIIAALRGGAQGQRLVSKPPKAERSAA
jgi:hypothetical protein